jgi:putative inorganic carbon (hco3(-)) transporter
MKNIFPRLVAAFPLLFPLYLFRGEILGIPVTLVEVLLGVMFLGFVFYEEVWRLSWWAKHGYKWKIYALWLFVLAAVMGLIVAPEVSYMMDGNEFPAQMKALGIFKGWIVAPMLYFFMARYYFHEKPALIPLALRAMLLGGVFMSLMAIQQVWTGDFITPDGRASGPFESANYLSLYLGPVVVYGLVAFAREKNFSWRIFLGISAGICLVALYATLSYAAWIGVLAALFVALFVHVKKLPKKVKLGLLASVILLGALALVSQLGGDKFEQFVDFSGRSSSTVRLQVYDIALNLIAQHPLLGIGLGQFEQFYQEFAIDILGREPFEWNMLHPHNIFLAFWLNMGLMGLVAFIWLCVKALPWLLEQDKKERRIAALMLVALLVHGMFDVPYFKNDLAFQFWLLLAILL